jgi:hypothetical protein
MKLKRISEVSAKDILGFLLYNPINKNHFFRVHDKNNPLIFEDYTITAEDVEIKLLSNFNALVEYNDGSKSLDYTSEVLGKC